MKKRALFSIGGPLLLVLIIFLQMHFSVGVSFFEFIKIFDYKLVLLLIYILIQVKLLLENSQEEHKTYKMIKPYLQQGFTFCILAYFLIELVAPMVHDSIIGSEPLAMRIYFIFTILFCFAVLIMLLNFANNPLYKYYEPHWRNLKVLKQEVIENKKNIYFTDEKNNLFVAEAPAEANYNKGDVYSSYIYRKTVKITKMDGNVYFKITNLDLCLVDKINNSDNTVINNYRV